MDKVYDPFVVENKLADLRIVDDVNTDQQATTLATDRGDEPEIKDIDVDKKMDDIPMTDQEKEETI